MNFKQKFITSTAMALTLISGYGRRGYASCILTGAPNYSCSGINTTTQIINAANNAVVTTTPGFSVAASSGNGIEITGDNVSFLDQYASYIKGATGITAQGDNTTIETGLGSIVIGDTGHGISSSNLAGALSTTVNGQVTGQIHGIWAGNYTLTSDSIIYTGVDSIIIGETEDGIKAMNYGSGVLSIDVNGSVTGSQNGIYAYNTGTNLAISTGLGSQVTGTSRFGINAQNFGTGTLSIIANGDVTGNVFGIYSINSGTDLSIVTGADSQITGTTNVGIGAINNGTGVLSVEMNGNVWGQNYGLRATNYGTDLIVTTGADSMVWLRDLLFLQF